MCTRVGVGAGVALEVFFSEARPTIRTYSSVLSLGDQDGDHRDFVEHPLYGFDADLFCVRPADEIRFRIFSSRTKSVTMRKN